ncbi:MAG: 3-dehydroquinate synthase [Verrucomicrobiae bacterium]|nr:3-dehydroquinate synthase [Verrucomicrobiae bacterium]
MALLRTENVERVRVPLGERTYEIFVGRGLLDRIAEVVKPLGLGRQGVVISDTNVAALYGMRVCEAFRGAGFNVGLLTFSAGEASKSLRQASRLLEKLPAFGLDRQSFVVALGGGVVGDLAGFVAAVYLRGIHYIQVPTTLLAMVDSSVGGKTGVNLPQGKNLVGAFYQPRLVIADTATLRTLPRRELRAGFAEVIKYGAISDAAFFRWLEGHYREILRLDSAAIRRTVRRCCELKAEVVSADERESGLRAILNFGHTVGHAMEALVEYEGLLHGEAVAVGMCCAARLSVKRAGLREVEARRLQALIAASGLPTRLGKRFSVSALREAMRLDKKARAGRLRFVLLERLGKAVVSDDVTEADIEEVLHVCR